MLPILITLLTIIPLSCSLFRDEDEPLKDPRTYEFTIDTIRYEGKQVLFKRLWGSSDKDVYICGFSDFGATTLNHFNGIDWLPVLLRQFEGGNICCSFKIYDIWGFAKDNIWGVGIEYFNEPDDGLHGEERSIIIHYDGIDWQKVDTPPSYPFYTIGGSGPNNIFAGGGNYGILFHYDGDKWTEVDVPLPDSYKHQYFSQFTDITRSTDKDEPVVYMIATNYTEFSYLLRYSDNELTVTDSFETTSNLGDLWLSPEGNLYITGKNISKYIGNQKQVIHEGEYHKLAGISGTSEDNIFVVGQRPSGMGYGIGVILHFNGTDWYQYPDVSTEWGDIHRIQVFKNSIFCTMQNSNSYISTIIRGE